MANKIQEVSPFGIYTVSYLMNVKMATGLHYEQSSRLLSLAELHNWLHFTNKCKVIYFKFKYKSRQM